MIVIGTSTGGSTGGTTGPASATCVKRYAKNGTPSGSGGNGTVVENPVATMYGGTHCQVTGTAKRLVVDSSL